MFQSHQIIRKITIPRESSTRHRSDCRLDTRPLLIVRDPGGTSRVGGIGVAARPDRLTAAVARSGGIEGIGAHSACYQIFTNSLHTSA